MEERTVRTAIHRPIFTAAPNAGVARPTAFGAAVKAGRCIGVRTVRSSIYRPPTMFRAARKAEGAYRSRRSETVTVNGIDRCQVIADAHVDS
jgi:hypothetical protein